VLVRWLALPLVVSVAFVAGCAISEDSPVDQPTKPIAGNWTGTLKQKGLKPFRIAVRIEVNGSGHVAYTGIECGGKWTLGVILDSRPPIYEFKEQINEGVGGECKGTGDVSFHPDLASPRDRVHYGFRGGGVTSHGVLHRTDASGLRPVFDEAGVTPP
jgi:hypothetical protein